MFAIINAGGEMDLSKIGGFIRECRKAKGITQLQLAQQIMVSEKTISKWECGRGFPDASLMLPLCQALEISANELLCGKRLPNESEYKQNAEENLIILKGGQDRNAKRLLAVEWLIVWFAMVIFLSCVILPNVFNIAIVLKILIIIFGATNLIIALCVCFFIEAKVGFYKCGRCGHLYIPTFNQIMWSMHMGRTRYMKCPKCKHRSWNKKTTKNK